MLSSPAAEPSGEPVDIEPEEEPEEPEEPESEEPKKRGKPRGSYDPMGIARCCSALRQNLANVPDEHKGTHQLAIAACEGARKNGALMSRVRQLAHNTPPVCR